MQFRTEHITVGILLIAILLVLGGMMSGNFSPATIIGSEKAVQSSPQPTRIPSQSISPALSPSNAPTDTVLEDNPERINNDDNPGESNKRGRGKDRDNDR